MKKKCSIICFFLFISLSFAEASDKFSAYRKINRDYTFYISKLGKVDVRSPLSISRFYDGTGLPRARNWTSLELLQSRFEGMRDLRFLIWRPRPNDLRRISWNYPDDGCYARASLGVRNLSQLSFPKPNKIFVFGNLRFKTKNSPRGVVGWWYHVAPIVEVNGVKFVLDPAINRIRPLLLIDWLKKMGDPAKMKVAICASGTFSPKDDCNKISDGIESRGKQSQQRYLGLEWNRMVNLGRESEL